MEARPILQLHRETQLATVYVASEGSESDGSDAVRGSVTRAGESDELISMTGTSRTMGFKGGRLGDIGLTQGNVLR